MPSPKASLTFAHATEHVAHHVFGRHDDPGCDACDRNGIGIELEFLTGTAGFERLTLERATSLMADLEPLPRASKLTLEPGGQLEVSTLCFDELDAACEAAATDLYRMDQVCMARGIDLVALGADPLRPPERIVTAPRYREMERFFDGTGHAGRTMMCNTAAIQINIGLGHDDEPESRWRLANALGPTFIASFANSPFARGTSTGWKSSRLKAWWELDPSRAAPVPTTGDPVARWVEYALDARVMLIRVGNDFRSPVTPLTFGQWLASGHELGWPTRDDWAYHLTTLFPPVRPKGWFELRMFDALPTPFWRVAAAVSHALLTDARAGDRAERAVAGTTDLWVDAAQLGLGHPALAQSSRSCFEVAIESLERTGGSSLSAEAVAAYYERWIARGRCPADDRRDAWMRSGELVPTRESPIHYFQDLAVGASRW
ncbi:MAG: ergothioneine biosynthesis glutamate--cysteine ligase EgtA [Actinobacteria bacterium]|nr:ergothioneine biosynthesis glutamate--cysteine ligase EgtA [Actinomycetota bacterium]